MQSKAKQRTATIKEMRSKAKLSKAKQAKQGEAKTNKAKQFKAMQSKAEQKSKQCEESVAKLSKQSKAKQKQTKQSKAKQSKAKLRAPQKCGGASPLTCAGGFALPHHLPRAAEPVGPGLRQTIDALHYFAFALLCLPLH